MSVIRDFLNRVIKRNDVVEGVAEDVAAPDARGVRRVEANRQVEGMTPLRLARIMRAADGGDVEAYFELAEEIEERDPHYVAQLATRKRSVAQLPITVKARSDDTDDQKFAGFVRDWIEEGHLRSSMFDMLDAIGKGISFTEVNWQVKNRLLYPNRLTWRTQRFFTFDEVDRETPLLRDTQGNLPLAEHKFVVHRSRVKSGLIIKSSIARVGMWAWMFKAFTQRDWATFVNNYGQPIRIGRYGPNATEEQKDILWHAVRDIAGECATIMPADMKIEFVETGTKSTSTDMYQQRADWLDRQVSKLILGQTTTTDAVSGGHAVAKEHRLVQEDIERSDALDLSDTLNASLIPNLIAFNFGPQKHYPVLQIGRPDEVPIGEFSEAFSKLAPQGLTAGLNYMRDRLGIPAPGDDEALIGAVRPQAGLGIGEGKAALSVAKHSRETLPMIETIARRLEDESASVFDGMIEEVRKVLHSARSLEDAAEKVAALELDPDELAMVMAQAMTLSHLLGQASLIDEAG